MKRKLTTTGLSIKRFVEIANKYHYSVEIYSYSGCLCGHYPFLKSPFGAVIETRKGFTIDALMRAFNKCN